MPAPPCPSCGAPPEPDARFCGVCGCPMPAMAAPPPDAAPAKGPVASTLVDPPAAPAVAAARAPGMAAPAAKTVPMPRTGPVRLTLDRLIGRALNNRYLVERKIGEGGFGAVFQGKQLATGRAVALKVLHPHNVADATVVARFRREAEACSKLHSPHTVIIYDFDETEDGILYLAMELLHGKSLQQLQRSDGPLDPKRVLGILDQVADALGEAHQHGIIHRDMKPENVMVDRRGDEDAVKVLDFGIAKIVSGGDGSPAGPALTAVGQTLGTLEFMSPEQLRGKALDGRSDIYALGMMTYEMLTGELPFKDAKSSTEVIEFHLQKAPPPPSKLRPEAQIPHEIDALVVKMVAKSRDDRHADAADLRRHIQEILGATDSKATRGEAVRVVAVVGGLLALVALIILLASR